MLIPGKYKVCPGFISVAPKTPSCEVKTEPEYAEEAMDQGIKNKQTGEEKGDLWIWLILVKTGESPTTLGCVPAGPLQITNVSIASWPTD